MSEPRDDRDFHGRRVAFAGLLADAVDGRLSDGQWDEFVGLLKSDSRLLDDYVDYFVLDQLLEDEFPGARRGAGFQPVNGESILATALDSAANSATVGREEPKRIPPVRLRRGDAADLLPRVRETGDRAREGMTWASISHSPRLYSTVTAAAVIAGLLLGLSIFRISSRPDQRSGSWQTFATVATLTRVERCEWGPTSLPTYQGAHLVPGTLSLKSGLMELRFHDGARVVVEGPAEFELSSPSAAALRMGKLTARVPKKAVGFAVETPIARIVDLGTEFAVGVDDDSTEVHIFKGMVSLRPGGERSPQANWLTLAAGQAWRSEGRSSAAPIARTFEANRKFAVVMPPMPETFLYLDNFDGKATEPLEGRMPKINLLGEKWGGIRNVHFAWRSDGSIVAGAASGNTSWLAFKPQQGKKYALALDVNPDPSKAEPNPYFALGFAERPDNFSAGAFEGKNGVRTYGWMRNYADDARKDAVQTYLGWDGKTTLAGEASHDVEPDKKGAIRLMIVLNTRPKLWTVQWHVDGKSVRGPVAFEKNPPIGAVGFGGLGEGKVDNFSLSILPEEVAVGF